MARNKTTFTGASVEEYLVSRASDRQRDDCTALMAMLQRLTGEAPRMWGPSIVGYGLYRYTYDSGHSGEAPVVGFAIRGRDIVVYLSADDDAQRALLARLGRHSMGKSCLYVRRLADLDLTVLEQLVVNSLAHIERRHGHARLS